MLLENVKGFVTKRRNKLGEIEQAGRLVDKKLADVNGKHGTSYIASTMHLDAANFGVPQHRQRVIIIAARDGREFVEPDPTHGPASLSAARRPSARLSTAWDAIGDLDHADWDPALRPTGVWADLLPSIPEAGNYLFHTPRGSGEPLFGWRRKYWSFLLKLAKDRPSWTIQAQPGPATGPFHWRSRKLSIHEMARLQTFPDDYSFAGGYASARKQVGNAVPVALGETLGLEIRRQLLDDELAHGASTVPRHREDRPSPEPPAAVPEEYLELRASHQDHPGPGQGPRARQGSLAFAAPL